MPASNLTMQIAGQGRLENHPPGILDGARFEGRFVIWGLSGPGGPLFGEDVSLFHSELVHRLGRGAQSAQLVAVRSGDALEGFSTGEDQYDAHVYGRASSRTRLQVFFDATPDGSRSFSDRQAFTQGELVATYRAEEHFQMDVRAEVFATQVLYRLEDSRPFTHHGVTVDFAAIAPAMLEHSHGHNPEPMPNPERIPHAEPPFARRGPGDFTERFAVGGIITALG